MRARSRSADKRPEAGTPRGPCGGAAGSGMGAHAHDGTFLAVRRNYSAGDSGKHHAERERPRAEATRRGHAAGPSARTVQPGRARDSKRVPVGGHGGARGGRHCFGAQCSGETGCFGAGQGGRTALWAPEGHGTVQGDMANFTPCDRPLH